MEIKPTTSKNCTYRFKGAIFYTYCAGLSPLLLSFAAKWIKMSPKPLKFKGSRAL
jgi:hypothetical protein